MRRVFGDAARHARQASFSKRRQEDSVLRAITLGERNKRKKTK
jgi:hypothetical protein